MTDIVLRSISYDDCTLGRLWVGTLHCFTLELPWKDNRKGVSCIPAGTYKYFKRKSPKNGNVVQLIDVPDRTFIQIHAGNYTRQIEGCILPGRSITYLDGDDVPDVTNSRPTLAALLKQAPDEGTIQIVRG